MRAKFPAQDRRFAAVNRPPASGAAPLRTCLRRLPQQDRPARLCPGTLRRQRTLRRERIFPRPYQPASAGSACRCQRRATRRPQIHRRQPTQTNSPARGIQVPQLPSRKDARVCPRTRTRLHRPADRQAAMRTDETERLSFARPDYRDREDESVSKQIALRNWRLAISI